MKRKEKHFHSINGHNEEGKGEGGSAISSSFRGRGKKRKQKKWGFRPLGGKDSKKVEPKKKKKKRSHSAWGKKKNSYPCVPHLGREEGRRQERGGEKKKGRKGITPAESIVTKKEMVRENKKRRRRNKSRKGCYVEQRRGKEGKSRSLFLHEREWAKEFAGGERDRKGKEVPFPSTSREEEGIGW